MSEINDKRMRHHFHDTGQIANINLETEKIGKNGEITIGLTETKWEWLLVAGKKEQKKQKDKQRNAGRQREGA